MGTLTEDISIDIERLSRETNTPVELVEQFYGNIKLKHAEKELEYMADKTYQEMLRIAGVEPDVEDDFGDFLVDDEARRLKECAENVDADLYSEVCESIGFTKNKNEVRAL